MYAINHNNQLYGNCGTEASVLRFCIKQKDFYTEETINYYDFSFNDCSNKKGISLCSDFITGLGVNEKGKLSKLIKNHKVILASKYTDDELNILCTKLTTEISKNENVIPWLKENRQLFTNKNRQDN